MSITGCAYKKMTLIIVLDFCNYWRWYVLQKENFNFQNSKKFDYRQTDFCYEVALRMGIFYLYENVFTHNGERQI